MRVLDQDYIRERDEWTALPPRERSSAWLRAIAVVAAVAALLSLAANPSTAMAAQREEVCIKYQKEYGWSKSYTVIGTVISGSDLNSKVGSLSRFKALSTYVVVFWDDDKATILELPPLSMGSVPMFESEARDQLDRLWKIKQGHTFCF
jgi:hypothetical protein